MQLALQLHKRLNSSLWELHQLSHFLSDFGKAVALSRKRGAIVYQANQRNLRGDLSGLPQDRWK